MARENAYQIRLYSDGGGEHELQLPSKFEVCGRCEGYGTHLNPNIGEYAYTREEFEEAFPEDEDKEQYFKRGGIYDVTCYDCKGRRVVPVLDEDCFHGSKAKENLLKRIHHKLKADAEYERECEAERRMERGWEPGY